MSQTTLDQVREHFQQTNITGTFMIKVRHVCSAVKLKRKLKNSQQVTRGKVCYDIIGAMYAHIKLFFSRRVKNYYILIKNMENNFLFFTGTYTDTLCTI